MVNFFYSLILCIRGYDVDYSGYLIEFVQSLFKSLQKIVIFFLRVWVVLMIVDVKKVYVRS